MLHRGPPDLLRRHLSHQLVFVNERPKHGLQLLVKDGKLQLNLEDDIIKSTLLTLGGEVVNPRVREFFALSPLAAERKGTA